MTALEIKTLLKQNIDNEKDDSVLEKLLNYYHKLKVDTNAFDLSRAVSSKELLIGIEADIDEIFNQQ